MVYVLCSLSHDLKTCFLDPFLVRFVLFFGEVFMYIYETKMGKIDHCDLYNDTLYALLTYIFSPRDLAFLVVLKKNGKTFANFPPTLVFGHKKSSKMHLEKRRSSSSYCFIKEIKVNFFFLDMTFRLLRFCSTQQKLLLW